MSERDSVVHWTPAGSRSPGHVVHPLDAHGGQSHVAGDTVRHPHVAAAFRNGGRPGCRGAHEVLDRANATPLIASEVSSSEEATLRSAQESRSRICAVRFDARAQRSCAARRSRHAPLQRRQSDVVFQRRRIHLNACTPAERCAGSVQRHRWSTTITLWNPGPLEPFRCGSPSRGCAFSGNVAGADRTFTVPVCGLGRIASQ